MRRDSTMRGQAEGQRGAPKQRAKVEQKGQREAPVEAENAASWVSKKIRLSFKKNPIELQIPPPRNAESHGPPAGRADHQAPDAEHPDPKPRTRSGRPRP